MSQRDESMISGALRLSFRTLVRGDGEQLLEAPACLPHVASITASRVPATPLGDATPSSSVTAEP